MHRSIKARPGSHAFLWIPSVRAFQTHPFTLVSNNPAEFVVDARDGFTKELHRLALENPKAMRRAAIEGPYGNMPSANDFDKVLLIAGGSGATCTLAMALDWVRRNKYSRDNRVLDFVWAVKSRGERNAHNADFSDANDFDRLPHMVRTRAIRAPELTKGQPHDPRHRQSHNQEQYLFSAPEFTPG